MKKALLFFMLSSLVIASNLAFADKEFTSYDLSQSNLDQYINHSIEWSAKYKSTDFSSRHYVLNYSDENILVTIHLAQGSAPVSVSCNGNTKILTETTSGQCLLSAHPRCYETYFWIIDHGQPYGTKAKGIVTFSHALK